MSLTEIIFFFLAIYLLFKAGPKLLNVLRGKNTEHQQHRRRRNPFADFSQDFRKNTEAGFQERHEGEINIEKTPKKNLKKKIFFLLKGSSCWSK